MLAFEKRPPWIQLVFAVRGSELPRIKNRLLAVFVTSVLLTYLEEARVVHLPISLPMLSLIGMALGIFLGFRNNTSYDRFWEGRKLWGQLVNTSRSLVRDLQTLATDPSTGQPSTDEDRAFWRTQAYRIIAFSNALRMQLRGQVDLEALAPLLSNEDRALLAAHTNVPNGINQLIGRDCARQIASRGHSDQRLFALSLHQASLTDIQGGCERIRATPVPHSYSVLLHRMVAIYVFALPFGLVERLHLMTPWVALLVSYTFLGLDAVGDELEDPFGEDLNDLPLSTICRTIEINVRQMLGEGDVPPPLTPIRGQLL